METQMLICPSPVAENWGTLGFCCSDIAAVNNVCIPLLCSLRTLSANHYCAFWTTTAPRNEETSVCNFPFTQQDDFYTFSVYNCQICSVFFSNFMLISWLFETPVIITALDLMLFSFLMINWFGFVLYQYPISPSIFYKL